MRVTAIYNNKGGVAKTMTAVQLAYNLSALGAKVLLIDMDQQGNASSFYEKYDLYKPSVCDFLEGAYNFKRVIRRTKYKGLDIVQANSHLRDVSEHEPSKLFKGIRETDGYDYVVIDCPPAAGDLVRDALEAADEVIIPVKAGAFSREGISTVLDIITDAGMDPEKVSILFTMISCRNPTQRRMIQEIMDTCNCGVFENFISQCSAVERSEIRKKPLMKCASRSRAAIEYMDFTKEYMEGESYGKA